jgi:hypothetical protein
VQSSAAASSYLRAVFPAERLIVINTEADLLAQPFVPGNTNPLNCKPSQPIEGLLDATLQGRPLRFDPDAPDLPAQSVKGKTGLILLENPAEISEVAVINYATAIDADVIIMPGVDRDAIQMLPRRLQA